MQIGFAILSHADQRQLKRLIEVLNEQYDNPPIACHHDTSKSPLDPEGFPSNVQFVAKPRRTGWGIWPVVQGGLDAISLLYRDCGPDWFFLLSAADYPIKSGSDVRQELASAKVDAFLDFRPVLPKWTPKATVSGAMNGALAQFNSAANEIIKRRFYVSPQLFFPVIRWRPRFRLGRFTWRPPFESPLHPFDKTTGCYCGDHWFCANRKAAQKLINPSRLRTRLARHYRMRALPDESFYQTMLLNQSDLRIERDNRRYAEWNGGGAHPMTLGEAQLNEMLASGAFFARKFELGAPVLDMIDARMSAIKNGKMRA